MTGPDGAGGSSMSDAGGTEPLRETYLDPATLPYAFCPGCSHGRVVDQLDAALVKLQLDPRQVVLVTDIGCAGIADKHFRTHSFHGLHGRSVTYATGIKLANPRLEVIVLIGDGGCGIGGHHLLSAARRNIGVTVLVFNNLNFGMTGGQHSVTSPPDSVTATTPLGHLEQPLDIAATAAVNGGGFVARATAFDPDLPDLIAEAIRYDGFSVIDIWELCTAYYVPGNAFSRTALEETMARLGAERGVIRRDGERAEYSTRYDGAAAAVRGQPTLPARPLPAAFASTLDRPMRIAIAGSAGQRIRTSGTLLATGAVLSGLWATRRDDYPITVRSGYSLAEVILSPHPILYAGAPRPDVAVVLAPEGAGRLKGALATMDASGTVLRLPDLGPLDTPARLLDLALPSAARPHARKSLSTLAAAELVRALDLYPLDALREACRRTQPPEVAAVSLAAIDALAEDR